MFDLRNNRVNYCIKVRGIIVGIGVFTDSKVNRICFNDHDSAIIADHHTVRTAEDATKERCIYVNVGNLLSAELLYISSLSMFDVMDEYCILGVEIETAGIYVVCAK